MDLIETNIYSQSINNEEKDSKPPEDSMQILEKGLVLCQFGKFHLRLLAATLCSVFASVMVITTSSYILPVAECDLDMNNMRKGLLNAMPFIGQVGATLFAGFLVDTFGRRVFLVGGNFGIFVFTLLEGSSQTYWMLITMKFFEGVSLSLSFSAISAMLTEFIHKNVRDRVFLVYGSFKSMSLIVTALLSWALLPLRINLTLLEGYFELHSWNVYLYVCSIWSLLAALLYSYLPESPKFLLSHGQEKKALDVLKKIYCENTGKAHDTFPIKSLSPSGVIKGTSKLSVKRQLVNELYEVKQLFYGPLLLKLLMFCVITFVCLSTYMSLRLWYPQLSTIIENYQIHHKKDAQFCEMINEYRHDLRNSSITVDTVETKICIPQLSGTETYLNAVILGLVSLLFMGTCSFLVDYLGQKLLMFVILMLCSASSIILYWTNSSIQIAILLSATCGFLQTTLNLQQNVLVRVFPTTLRALAISVTMMVGRIGSLSGSILFPIFLEMGCMTPFLIVSAATFCVAGVVYFLPNPKKENSEVGDR